MVSVNNISKEFDGNYALNDISFDVKKGEIFGFLGPSGSGKTTAIKILTKQTKTSSGEGYILGKNLKELIPEDFQNIGIMSDTSGFYEHLTLYENLKLFANILKSDIGYLNDLLKEVELYEDRDKKAKNLSNGMKNRLLLVRALLAKPDLLFLDEPTSSLDPNTTRKIHNIFEKVQNQGTTIFLTTHDMNEAKRMCDRLVLLYNGKIAASGTPNEIIHSVTHEVEATITFSNNTYKVIPIKQLNTIEFNEEIISIHTSEPTLEEAFIQLTGEGLYD